MTRPLLGLALAAPLALAACVETGDGGGIDDPAFAPGTNVAAEQACLAAVRAVTDNADQSVVRAVYSEAATEVIIAVGPQRAPWQCYAYADGTTDRVSYLGSDG